MRDYIAAAANGQPGLVEAEPWSRETSMRDTVMLGLRLAEGITTGRPIMPDFGSAVARHRHIDAIQASADTGLRQVL